MFEENLESGDMDLISLENLDIKHTSPSHQTWTTDKETMKNKANPTRISSTHKLDKKGNSIKVFFFHKLIKGYSTK